MMYLIRIATSSGWHLLLYRSDFRSLSKEKAMSYGQIEAGVRLYYELTGPEEAPVVVQFGGGLFGRHNFGLVNDGFREKGFRLLSFDARGYGASDHPREPYTIEGWADDGAGLLDAVGLDRVFVHGTSMGGMIAIAFTAKYPERVIAACADVAFAKPDLYRKTLFRVWRRMVESMPWDDFSDHVTTQAVGARFMESPEGANVFELVREIVGLNDPYTVRQACLAMEDMDLSPLVPRISRPLLMTNGTYDVLCPPDLAPSGLGARKMAEMNSSVSLVEFPDIGHADLVECPEDAIRIVTEFFQKALVRA
jgi:pimeloyl-ACP methyl ester carboxylesterase